MEGKSRLYRILEMISLLSSKHRKWKVKELAEHFAVSSRTIYRDFEVMEEMRIPVYNDNTDHTYSILDNFYFQQPDMTRDEALALLLVGQAFIEETFPYHENLNSAIAKIISSLPPSIKKIVDDIGSQMSYQHGAFVDLKPYKSIIQDIEDAVKDKMSIFINYYTLSRDQLNERKIDPYQIFYTDGAFYLIAYCHMRQDILIFRVDRIKDMSITEEKYIMPDNFNMDKYMKNAWGVERSDNEKRVELIFEGKAARLVKEKVWNPTQQIIELLDNKIKFIVTTGSMEEIKSWILSYGSSVEVVSPESLKQEITGEIDEM
ncbi:MAG: helix-turn-helix transcriptional regulator, partial [Halothermotrichaceae bacterium]